MGLPNWVNLIWDGPMLPVATALRFSQYLGDSVERLRVSYPTQDKKKDDEYDRLTYGNVFLGAANVLRNAFVDGLPLPSTEHEHFTRHLTFTGQLAPRLTENPLILKDTTITHFGNFPKYCYTNVYRQVKVLGFGPLSLSPITETWGHEYTYLPKLIDAINDNNYHYCWGLHRLSNAIGAQWKFKISDMDFHISDDGSIDMRYHVDCENVQPSESESWSWDSHWSIPIDVPTKTPVSPVVNSNYGFFDSYSEPYTYSTFLVSNYVAHGSASRPGASNFTRVKSVRILHGLKTLPVLFSSESHGKQWSLRESQSATLNSIRSNFERVVSLRWSDIVASSAFSAVDAISNLSGSLDKDVLQTLVKIPSISTALPDVRAAVDLLGRLSRKDLSGATFRDILDLATSTNLQANFQWRPYSDLLLNVLPVMLSTLPNLFAKRRLGVGYGSFSYKITSDFGRETVFLTTRSKVTVDLTLSGVMSASLTLDDLGLLPRFSRAWDLIPFSFALNWFTGLGKILSQMETLSIAALVPSTWVHSYTLISPLKTGELDALEASFTGNSDASLRYYIRDISRYSPVPKPSRIPFGVPATFPSSGVVASLIVQLLLG
jgi:hypothetical protein